MEDRTKNAPGTVYFVGAGPGDPDLLTRRAHRVLREADIVAYDSLIAQALLDELPSRIELRPCGKHVMPAATRQGTINRLLVEEARTGKAVVRLKGGDPSVFGRLAEEIDCLSAHRIPYEVVPGITAASAGAAALGISLTDRSLADGVTFISGHSLRSDNPQRFADLASGERTVVAYMAVATLGSLTGSLREAGLPADTPVAIVQHAAHATEKRVAAPLETIAATARERGIEPPAVVIIGGAEAPALGECTTATVGEHR